MIAYLAAQVGVPAEAIESYAFSSRSARRHRQVVLNYLALSAHSCDSGQVLEPVKNVRA